MATNLLTKAPADLTHAELVAIFSSPYMTPRKEAIARAVGHEPMVLVQEEIRASKISAMEQANANFLAERQRVLALRRAEEERENARLAARLPTKTHPLRILGTRFALALANLI